MPGQPSDHRAGTREVPEQAREALERLRTVLSAASYTPDGIAALGIEVGLGVRRPDVPFLARALASADPLSTLVRLFLLGEELLARDVERTTALDVDGLCRAGLLERRDDRVLAKLHLTPWRGLVFAHDPDPEGDLWRDHVAGPNPAAEMLAQLMVEVPVESALDLGTGSGILALLAARPADRVVATDVNTHALQLTALNAELNEVRNVETREGSFFDPVGEARFQLIVSNPPFVISPESALVFRHSRLPRDEVSRLVVQGAGQHLEEAGFAHVLCNWVQVPTEDWHAAPVRWLAGSGCDALLFHHSTEDPLGYATRWNARLQTVDPAAYPATLDRWLAYYRSEGIEAIASGALILRRRQAARNWTHALEMPPDAVGDSTGHLLRIVAGQDYLARLDEERAMLTHRFRLADRHRIDQSLVFRGDRYAIQPASLGMEEGLGLRAAVEPALMTLLFRLDGARPLGAMLAEVASETGSDRDALTNAGLALVRRLVDLGFLEAPGLDGSAS